MDKKPQPLNLNFREYVCTNGVRHNEKICDYDEVVLQIESAVKWLKEDIKYRDIPKGKELILQLIDKAFPIKK